MSDKDILGTVAIKVSCIHTHTGLCSSIPVYSRAGQQCFVFESAVLLVNPELVGIAVICNVDVGPAIIVEVSRNHAQRMSELFVYSGADGHIFKSSITAIMKETVAGRSENARRAIVSRTRGGITRRTGGRGKPGIVHHHQIQPTVAVVIEKHRTGTPARIVSSCTLSHIDKGAIAFVKKHLVGAEVCKIQIG